MPYSNGMTRVTLEIPEDLSTALAGPGQDLSRAVLEASAIEAFRERKLSKARLRRLLGFETGHELDTFLKEHEVWIDYSVEDMHRDLETHRRLGI